MANWTGLELDSVLAMFGLVTEKVEAASWVLVGRAAEAGADVGFDVCWTIFCEVLGCFHEVSEGRRDAWVGRKHWAVELTYKASTHEYVFYCLQEGGKEVTLVPVKTATALQAELSDSSLAPVIRVIKFTMGGYLLLQPPVSVIPLIGLCTIRSLKP